MAIHWSSYNSCDILLDHTGPILPITANGCRISVVLEEESSLAFEDIRVLVIYRPSEELKSLRITECTDPMMFNIPRGAQNGFYREALVSRSITSKYTKQHLANLKNFACNIVFEVVNSGNLLYYRYKLVPCDYFEHDLRHFRVAFDRLYRSTPTNPSVHIMLNSSHPFYPVPHATTDNPETWFIGRTPVHSVRIIPVVRRQRTLPELPPAVLRRIAFFALLFRQPGWRTELLYFGLVCKSWAHIVDLFLEGFDESDSGDRDNDKLGIIRVARALEKWPARAAVIRTFSPWKYESKLELTGVASLPKWNAILTVLAYATSIESLQFSFIHPTVVSEFIRLICKLRNVRQCKIDFMRFRSRTKVHDGDSLTMNAIQSLISGWENLEALEMSNWREPDLAESQDIPPLSGKIQSLLLQRGQLTGPHLMRFVAGERSRLRELHLFDIKKLSNGELLACLKAVAPTLSRVSIMHCTISTGNEELAIDAAMPELVALRSLSIDDSCIGLPSIERKRSTVPGKQVDGSVQIMEIFGKLSISPEGLASAMHITGWAKISLEPLGLAWTPAIVENMQKIASERGIMFSCATISNFTGEEFPFP